MLNADQASTDALVHQADQASRLLDLLLVDVDEAPLVRAVAQLSSVGHPSQVIRPSGEGSKR
jgi:hypothetical protein